MTASRALIFLLPGDLDLRTGGYAYDRQMTAGLRSLGWRVDVRQLDASFPFPTARALQSARSVLADIADDALVMIDGLAFGAMPALAEMEAGRLKLIGLVHHPLALETGLEAQQIDALRQAERRALATARGVIVTSAATQRALRDYAVPAERITVIEPGTAAAPVAAGSGSGTLALLCVATLTPRKGHETLLNALQGLKKHDWHLKCIGGAMGDDAYLLRLRAQLASCGLQERVTFAGEGDDIQVAAAYHVADLFVLPTHYEGYGMVVAEALARGLPVISSQTGAIPDLIGDHAGIVVPPGDCTALQIALKRVFDEPALLTRMRQGALAARDRLPRWQDSATRLSAVLEKQLAA